MSFDGEQQEDDEINSVLWVGNLDSKVTEVMLYELFFQAGPIKHIKIPKGNDGAVHKGYCFIHFHHEASVPYTINIMDGTSLFGRRLKLQPRPGSVHRKMMDQKQISEQRQGQELMLQQQQQQQQWFAQPQLAQIPNMFVYQNQMLQPYSPQNLNVNMPLSFQPQLTHQVMQIQMPQQPVQAAAQPLARTSAYQATAPRAQSQPRQPHQQQQQHTQVNGYAPYMSGMSSQQPRSVNPNVAASAAPSHFSQAANGPPLFQQHQPRGPRPRHSGHHHNNGQAMVNGNRMSYNHRAPLLQSLPQQPQQQQQQQQLFYNPMYQPQAAMPVVTAAAPPGEPQFLNGNQNLHEPQYYHRRPHQPQAMPPGVPTNPTNGFQNVQLYHY